MAVKTRLTGDNDNKTDKVQKARVMRDSEFMDATLLTLSSAVARANLPGERITTKRISPHTVVLCRKKEGAPDRYYEVKIKTTG